MKQVWRAHRFINRNSSLYSSIKHRVPAPLTDFNNARCRSQFKSSVFRYTRSMASVAEGSPDAESVRQLVQHGGKEYRVIREGRASILKPPAETAATQATRRDLKPEDRDQSVFYNPIQQFNRDLTVLAIRVYGEHVMASSREKHRKRQAQGNTGGRNNKKRKRGNEDDETKEQESKPNDNAQPQTTEENQQKPDSQREPQPQPQTPFTILDALSASGLRALRYASEIPFVTRVVANDLSSSAIESMKLNVEYNQLEKLIQPNTGDARLYMYSRLKPATIHKQKDDASKFDVIDLDPYGTAAPFIDAAVQGIKDEGLLCITCTDAAVWASNGYPEKAFTLYGGVSTKGTHGHEAGLRLILNSVANSAGKYGLAIEPLLSLSIDFYARVFVRIHRSPAQAKFMSGNTMVVYNCDSGCGAWTTQPLTQTKQKLDKKGNPYYHFGFAQAPTGSPNCEHCGMKTHLSGPMWAGPLHNSHFIQKILDTLPHLDRDVYQTIDRVEGMLTTALEEDLSLQISADEEASQSPPQEAGADAGADADVLALSEDAVAQSEDAAHIIPRNNLAVREPYPFYFNLASLSRVLHTHTVPYEKFCGAIRHLGYRCSRSHAKPNTIRTDAPWAIVWEIMREWVRQEAPVKETSIRPGTAAAGIFAKGRENLSKADPQLEQLKRELTSVAESSKGLSDLVTKVEAALYRSKSGAVPSKNGDGTEIPSNGAGEVAPQKIGLIEAQAGTGSSVSRPCSELQVNFDESLGKQKRLRKRLVRYQINPRANWGPLGRASGRS